ncbi:MAG: hypothetical protein EBW42_16485, partial [Rhodobacterales bacterium]|nr:hypothetical protein [Rhodobacterales bacterium]
TLELRRKQLASAIEKGTEKIDVYRRAVESLENNIEGIRAEALALDGQGIWITLIGLMVLILAKFTQSIFANWALERRFSEWRSDPSIRTGFSILACVVSLIFMGLVVVAAVIHYSFPNRLEFLADFPTNPDLRLGAISYVERFFEYCVLNGEAFFDAITRFIRMILDALETIFVGTPWIVVASLLILLTHLSAGPRMAIYTAAFLSYMGLLGFWEKAMTTLALLGTAACLSIIIGIPLGMFCARRQRLYAVIQPIMDFMQTMPAFGCDLAVRKDYPLYCTYNDPEKIAAFAPAGYTCHGGLDDLLAVADIVIDCSPGKVGAANKEAYVKAGVKYIFQGG